MGARATYRGLRIAPRQGSGLGRSYVCVGVRIDCRDSLEFTVLGGLTVSQTGHEERKQKQGNELSPGAARSAVAGV